MNTIQNARRNSSSSTGIPYQAPRSSNPTIYQAFRQLPHLLKENFNQIAQNVYTQICQAENTNEIKNIWENNKRFFDSKTAATALFFTAKYSETKPLTSDEHTMAISLLPQESEQLKNLDPQEITMIAWALWLLNIDNPDLLNAISDEVLASGKISQFDSQETSYLVSSFSNFNLYRPDLFNIIESNIIFTNKIKDFSSKHLSYLAVAFSTLPVFHVCLFDAIIEELLTSNKINECTARDFTCIASAVANRQLDNPLFLNILALAILNSKKLNDCTPCDLTYLYNCFNKSFILKLEDPHVDILLKAIEEKISSFTYDRKTWVDASINELKN